MTDKIKIEGFILAGGQSSRMGANKALLLIENEHLIDRMIRLVRPFCATVSISGDQSTFKDSAVKVVPDLVQGIGPIAGISASLSNSASDWNLILGVDLPLINKELIETLIAQIGSADCLVPVHHGHIEPLAALYNRRIVPVLDDMINQSDYKMMNLFNRINTIFVDCELLTEKFPRLFFNLNNPEDFASL
jgi:molybdopterin-guanine dinucleotide biosynthesis protein A